MKTYKVEITLGINAMNDESAENKLETFLSALDLKKNDKLELVEMGELTESGSATKSKATASKKKAKQKAKAEKKEKRKKNVKDQLDTRYSVKTDEQQRRKCLTNCWPR